MHSLVENELVAFCIEAQPASSDELQVEACQIEAAAAARVGDTVADAEQSILGEIHQGRSGGLETGNRPRPGVPDATETARSRPSQDSLTLGCPPIAPTVAAVQKIAQPLGCVGLRIDGTDGNGGQRIGLGHSDMRGAITSPALTVVARLLAVYTPLRK